MNEALNKVNINTIAKLSGVSASTVSNFTNCTETFPISPKKQLQMMKVMRELNYRPNSASSQLRRNSSLPGKVIFIYGNFPSIDPFNVISQPFLSEIIIDINAALKNDLGVTLEVRNIRDENRIEDWNETIADGEAIICYGKVDIRLLKLVRRRNIPLLLICECEHIHVREESGIIAEKNLADLRDPISGEPILDCVYWDASGHMDKIMDHIYSLGAKKVAFVSSWNTRVNNPEGFAVEAEAKITEFERFIKEHNDLSGEVIRQSRPDNTWIYYEETNVYEILMRYELRKFDAIIGHNDFVARGIMAALKDQNLQVGDDMIVCGEGNFLACRYSIPPFTTVNYDTKLMSRTVSDMLQRYRQAGYPRGDHILIPSRIIVRN